MVLDHARRLHQRIHSGWTDKAEPKFLHGLTKRFGLFACSFPFKVLFVGLGFLGGIGPHQLNQVNCIVCDNSRVIDCRDDLGSVSYDALVLKQLAHLTFVKSGNFVRFEVIERLPKTLAPFENGYPAQPCLKALQADSFEERYLIFSRGSPFGVVVVDVDLIVSNPAAALKAIRVNSSVHL